MNAGSSAARPLPESTPLLQVSHLRTEIRTDAGEIIGLFLTSRVPYVLPLEEAVRRMAEHFGSRTGEIFMHCGPAICGECYEVGPEVHLAVHPARPSPAARAPIDLRGALAGRGIAAGLSAIRVTISAHCSRCGPGAFFSHRAGSVGRQMGVLGRTE